MASFAPVRVGALQRHICLAKASICLTCLVLFYRCWIASSACISIMALWLVISSRTAAGLPLALYLSLQFCSMPAIRLGLLFFPHVWLYASYRLWGGFRIFLHTPTVGFLCSLLPPSPDSLDVHFAAWVLPGWRHVEECLFLIASHRAS